MTRPLTAFSIWCGDRGGSTEIVGTTSLTAPKPASCSTVGPDCAWVRGTSTRQPNRGLVSNQDALSRRETPGPVTATSRSSPVAATSSTAALTSRSVATAVRWDVVDPPTVTLTPADPSWPASTRAPTHATTSSGTPSTTTVPCVPATAAASWRPPASSTCTAPVPEVVTGTPACSGTAVASDTPGTTSTGTPARRTATSSSASGENSAPSPGSSRTTCWPAFAARVTSRARAAAVRGLPSSSVVGSTSSTPAGQDRASRSLVAGSATTTSAAASSSVARTVSRPGSPGPAPTNAAVAMGFLLVRALTCHSPVGDRGSPSRSGGPRRSRWSRDRWSHRPGPRPRRPAALRRPPAPGRSDLAGPR